MVFVVSYAAAIPFMNTTLIAGPVATAWHGADIAYFVNFAVAAAGSIVVVNTVNYVRDVLGGTDVGARTAAVSKPMGPAPRMNSRVRSVMPRLSSSMRW